MSNSTLRSLQAQLPNYTHSRTDMAVHTCQFQDPIVMLMIVHSYKDANSYLQKEINPYASTLERVLIH